MEDFAWRFLELIWEPRGKSNSDFQFMLKLKTNNCVERVGQVRVFRIDLNQELQTGEYFQPTIQVEKS